MKRESKSQHVNEIAAYIWFAVERDGLSFGAAVDRAKENRICPPIAFSEGVELAKDWL